MAVKRDKDKNIFGSELERLLLLTELKNSTVSDALNYDVSYISKWTTGKSLPSAKNIDNICTAISELIVDHGSEAGVEKLLSNYGVANRELLQRAVNEMLMDAFSEATGKFNESKYLNNAAFKASPKGDYPLMTEYVATIQKGDAHEVAVMADIFALDHASKLKMAGIQHHKFVIDNRRDDVKVNYVINLESLEEHSVYDVLLLVHLMTNFSRTDFRLYYSPLAAGKLMIAMKEEFAAVSMLGNNKQFLCTTTTRDKAAVADIYQSIGNNIELDKVIFFSTDMDSLLQSHEYLQTLITQDTRWLIGHITEHFISPELFAELKDEYFGDTPEVAREAERAYIIGKNAIANKQVRIMMYSSAMVDYALSGELDFFNRKVMLTPEQRSRELVYLKELVEANDGSSFKLLSAGFSDDFKYVTNPCIFLAESLDYLRLENGQYDKNLMLIKDDKARKVFDVFFEEIWNYKHELVISDPEAIKKKMEGLISTAELLAVAEK